MRRIRFLCALALVVALPASAGAATILGKPRAEQVRGSARADLIDVVGGGSDRVSCGRGIDTVAADASDRLAADCEVVARRVAVDSSNGGGAHATIVEPSAAANGSTVVAVFQEGRRAEGADAFGFTTSRDAGTTWRSGVLPITGAGGWEVASDPVVAWDALHRRWIATALAFKDGTAAILADSSADGIAWNPPAAVVAQPWNDVLGVPLDKEWIACDDGATSPRRGTCYVAATTQPDTPAGRLALWSSSDGGVTWTAGASVPHGYFSQLAVRPDGVLVTVYLDLDRRVLVAATSSDGGASFASSVDVAQQLRSATEPKLRAPSLATLASGPGNALALAWASCGDALCSRETIQLSRSLDGGTTWGAPHALPLGPGLHVIPALAADPSSGRLVLTNYVEHAASCCAITAQVASSSDDGATWTLRRASVRPFRRSWLASALGGSFLGDYVATVFAGRRAISVLPLAEPPVAGRLREDLYAVRS